MAADCIFCRIADGEIPARVVFADDQVVAFHDVAPKAPTHVLVIPRRHIATLYDAGADDAALLGRLNQTAIEVARQLGLVDGFRLVFNCGEHAGQSVFHIHFHVLGGRLLLWPPG